MIWLSIAGFVALCAVVSLGGYYAGSSPADPKTGWYVDEERVVFVRNLKVLVGLACLALLWTAVVATAAYRLGELSATLEDIERAAQR